MMALTLGLVRRYHELQLGTGGMKPVNEQHFAILRRHMVEVIGIHTDLLEEELGKATFEKRILTTLLRTAERAGTNLFHIEDFVAREMAPRAADAGAPAVAGGALTA